MTIDEILNETFTDHEHLVPDAAGVLREINTRLDRRPRQRLTRLAPFVVAAVIVAVALTAVIVRSTAGHSARPTAGVRPTGVRPTGAGGPQTAAKVAARALLRTVPLPPGARAEQRAPAAVKNGPMTELSSLQAEASGTWVAPGTVSATIAFARSHPAPGFRPNCTCGGPALRWVDFSNEDDSRAIEYVVAPYASGVAIKITAIVPWVPTRPRWTYVSAGATSVDVTVERIRRNGSAGGAPTVHRTLGVDAARRLAAVANGLRSQAPSTCLGPVIMIAVTDTLVFHEPGRTITFTMPATNCPQFVVDVTGQKPAYLETGTLDATLLRELNLPPDYGR